MKLKKTIIKKILSNRSILLNLQDALGYTEQWIGMLLKANKVNGPLTTVAAVRIITAGLGVLEDEVLEEGTVKVAA